MSRTTFTNGSKRIPMSIDLPREIECHGTRMKKQKVKELGGLVVRFVARATLRLISGRPERSFIFKHIRGANDSRPCITYTISRSLPSKSNSFNDRERGIKKKKKLCVWRVSDILCPSSEEASGLLQYSFSERNVTIIVAILRSRDTPSNKKKHVKLIFRIVYILSNS